MTFAPVARVATYRKDLRASFHSSVQLQIERQWQLQTLSGLANRCIAEAEQHRRALPLDLKGEERPRASGD